MAKRKANILDVRVSADLRSTTENGSVDFKIEAPAKDSDSLINDANALSLHDFTTNYINSNTLAFCDARQSPNEGLSIEVKSAQGLSEDELDQCFNLIASTSRPDYEASSWGWHPKRKKREMREDEMRYLLVRSKQPAEDYRVQGFLSFMLTHDSTPSVPVLYIYEIHLAPSLRKLGLGAHLMHMAEDVAQSVGVEKVMLTCFLSNHKARSFYEKRGYSTDVSSPEDRTTRRKVVKVDYVIMSRDVEGGTNANG